MIFENYPELRFCKIRKGTKKPFEIDWVNKPYTWQEIQKHISEEMNYGVLCGYGNLIVIDSDTPELKKAVEENLPKTFRVRTGSGGTHDYFFCKEIKKKIKLQKGRNEHFGEVQSYGSQVVGAGSIHPTGNKYEIIQDLPIAEINPELLLITIKPFQKEIEDAEKIVLQEIKDYGDSDINSIDILQVINISGFKKASNGEYYGSNPWHNSETGMNTWINPSKNVAYCFRCEAGINVAKAIALNEGIISLCDEHLTREQFFEVLKIAEEKHGLKRSIKEEVLTKLASKQKSQATELMVQEILLKNKIYTIRDDENSEMWIYKDGIYIPQGKTFIREYSRDILGEAYTSHLTNEIIAKIETETYIDQKEFFNPNLTSKEEIAIQNGILNLRTKKIKAFTSEEIFFNKLPIIYDPSKDCQNIKQHFKAVLKNEEKDLPVIQELFGYLLLREHCFEKAFMFIGSGRNGKSKSLELMKRFLGPENCANIPLQQFETDNYAMGELFNKMANLAGDISREALKNSGAFKNLTGRDMISAQRKFLTRVHFVSYAKQIFCCNELPIVYDMTPAFWDRWIILEFPYQFLPQNELNLIQDEELKKITKLADNKIIEKLTTEDELSGLLNWALEGLERLQKNNEFSFSKSNEEIKLLWMRKTNSFNAFLIDCIEENWEGSIAKEELRKGYADYCRTLKAKPISDKALRSILMTTLSVSESRIMENRVSEYYWEGITINYEKLNNITNQQVEKEVITRVGTTQKIEQKTMEEDVVNYVN